MFEFFFIISILFLILSGELDSFNLDKRISSVVLIIIFALSLLSEIKIKYTFQISPVSIFLIAIMLFMFLIMYQERGFSVMCGAFIAMLMMGIIYWLPELNTWYIKSIVCSLFASMVSTTYFQGSFISVFSCVLLEVLSTFIYVDFELIYFDLFCGDDKTTIILSFILPFLIMVLSEKRVRDFREGLNESAF